MPGSETALSDPTGVSHAHIREVAGKLGLRQARRYAARSRLDAPGVLPQVMARGIARQRVFQDDAEREDLTQRLARVAEAEALTVYAWALLPNHCQLLWKNQGRS